MEATVFTPTQVHLLKIFQRMKSEEDLREMKEVLLRYYSSKLDTILDGMWESGELDKKRLYEINKMDLHQLK